MANVEWIKITTDMFDNRKIKYLRTLPEGNNIVLIWVMLLTMAGRCNSGGMIFLTENIPYTTKILADEIGFDENIVKVAIAALEKLNMVTTNSGCLLIPGWEEYQNAEGLEKIREQTKLRVQKYREKQKAITDCNVTSNVTVTQCNATEEEKELEGDIDKKENTKRKNFIPPTVEEVKEYIDSVGSQVDAESFVAFYESKGWMVGKNKMKSWKAAIVTWEKRNGLKRSPPKKSDPVQQEDEELVGDDWWK